MNLFKFKCIFGSFLCLVGFLLYASTAVGYPPQEETESILNVFIDDYVKNDKLPESPLTFGILITSPHEEKWTINIDKKGQQKFELKKGFPDQPTF